MLTEHRLLRASAASFKTTEHYPLAIVQRVNLRADGMIQLFLKQGGRNMKRGGGKQKVQKVTKTAMRRRASGSCRSTGCQPPWRARLLTDRLTAGRPTTRTRTTSGTRATHLAANLPPSSRRSCGRPGAPRRMMRARRASRPMHRGTSRRPAASWSRSCAPIPTSPPHPEQARRGAHVGVGGRRARWQSAAAASLGMTVRIPEDSTPFGTAVSPDANASPMVPRRRSRRPPGVGSRNSRRHWSRRRPI